MNQRERNRIREHRDHKVIIVDHTSPLRDNQKLVKCGCTWSGWVSEETAITMTKEE